MALGRHVQQIRASPTEALSMGSWRTILGRRRRRGNPLYMILYPRQFVADMDVLHAQRLEEFATTSAKKDERRNLSP